MRAARFGGPLYLFVNRASRELDRQLSPTELAGCQSSRSAHDVVASGCVGQKAPNLEGTARSLGRPNAVEPHDPVLADDDAPLLADDVLIDLELGLDESVVELRLQLPGRRGAARAALDHLGVAASLRK